METYYINLKKNPSIKDELSLCLGYFDGLHLGHLELIKEAINSPYSPSVLTLEFKKGINIKNKERILSLEDKEKILASMGVKYLFVLEFDEGMKNLSHEDFLEDIILKLPVKKLIVGEDFTYGHNKEGNIETLKDNNHARYYLTVLKDRTYQDKKISTRDIISFLKEGNLDLANILMGRFYSIKGRIEQGFHLGSHQLFPTANIDFEDYVVPSFGVYAVLILLDNQLYQGMANVGIHPTVNQLSSPLLEVNIFDFDQNIYSKEVTIYFIKYIRKEIKFTSIDSLKEQLITDRESIKHALRPYFDSNVALIPFLGMKDFIFEKSYDELAKLMNNHQGKKHGPSYEMDQSTIIYEQDGFDLVFSMDNKLIEIDYYSSSLPLFNGIKVGMKKDDAFKKDPSLIKTDLEGFFLSSLGYVLAIFNDQVSSILIFESQTFLSLVLFDSLRETKDELKKQELIKDINNYLENKISKDQLKELLTSDLSILHEIVMSHKTSVLINIIDIIEDILKNIDDLDIKKDINKKLQELKKVN